MPTDARPIQQSLDYFGVRSETHDGATWIHIPPLPSVRDLSRGYWWVLYPLLATVLAIAAMRSCLPGSGDAPAQAFPAIMYLCVTLLVVAFALNRLRRYVILQVTSDELRLLRVRRGPPDEIHRWPRSRITDVHINRSNGKLWMRVEGTDPVEIYLTPSLQVNEWICEHLNTALREPESAAEPRVGLSYESAFEFRTKSPKSAVIRRVLLGSSFVLTVLGIVALFTPIGPLGCYLWMFAGAPAGIALGTQKKEFYV